MNNLPTIQTTFSAGADLKSAENLTLQPGDITAVSTGYKYTIGNEHAVGLVRGRSGMAFKHKIFAYEGTIDADYIGGEVKVLLENKGTEPYKIVEGDRIAQLVVCPIVTANYFETEGKERNANGFGSTGV